jgi:predicted GIY-YIG superfamily endonuclease
VIDLVAPPVLLLLVAWIVHAVEEELARRRGEWLIYVLRDGDGVPLYVGLTKGWERRSVEHVAGEEAWRKGIDLGLSGPVRWCHSRGQALRIERRKILVFRLACDLRLCPPPRGVMLRDWSPRNRVHNRRPRSLFERARLGLWLLAYRLEAVAYPELHVFARVVRRAPVAPVEAPPVGIVAARPSPSAEGSVLDGGGDPLEELWALPAFEAPAAPTCQDCGAAEVVARGRCLACKRAHDAERKRRSRGKGPE